MNVNKTPPVRCWEDPVKSCAWPMGSMFDTVHAQPDPNELAPVALLCKNCGTVKVPSPSTGWRRCPVRHLHPHKKRKSA